MTETQIHEIVTAQREYFYTGATLDIIPRLQMISDGSKKEQTE